VRAKTRLPDGHGFVTVAVLLICNFLTDVHLIALSVHFVPAEIVRCIIAEQLVALFLRVFICFITVVKANG